jgi:hypothetical protein
MIRKDDVTHILERSCDDFNDKVTVSFVHAFFTENVDDDL